MLEAITIKTYYVGGFRYGGELYHYGRKGMKWGKNIFGDDGREGGSSRTRTFGGIQKRDVGANAQAAVRRQNSGSGSWYNRTASSIVGSSAGRQIANGASSGARTNGSSQGVRGAWTRENARLYDGAHLTPQAARAISKDANGNRNHTTDTAGSSSTSARGVGGVTGNNRVDGTRNQTTDAIGRSLVEARDAQQNQPKGLFDWIGGAVKTAGDWVGDRARDAGDWVGDRARDAGNWVSGAAKDVATWGKGAVDSGRDFIDRTFGGSTNADGSREKSVFDRAGDAVRTAGDWVGDRARDAGKFVTGGQNEDGSSDRGLIGRAENAARTAGDWVGDRARDVGGAVKTAGDWVGDRARDVGAAANRALNGTYDEKGGQNSSGLIDRAGNAVRTAGDWVGDRARDAGAAAGNAARDVGRYVTGGQNDDGTTDRGLIGRAENAARTAGDWVGDRARDAGSAVSSAARDVSEWGRDTLDRGSSYISSLFGGGNPNRNNIRRSAPGLTFMNEGGTNPARSYADRIRANARYNPSTRNNSNNKKSRSAKSKLGK